MENEEIKQFHFDRKNYFRRFRRIEHEHDSLTFNHINRSIRHALEYFIDDLKHDQAKTIEYFLTQDSIDEILLSIVRLLFSDENWFVDRINLQSKRLLFRII